MLAVPVRSRATGTEFFPAGAEPTGRTIRLRGLQTGRHGRDELERYRDELHRERFRVDLFGQANPVSLDTVAVM